jgi:hypothetical protein
LHTACALAMKVKASLKQWPPLDLARDRRTISIAVVPLEVSVVRRCWQAR